MDWGNEERNLASKVYTSQRPSTSIIVPTKFLLDDSDNIKKTEAKGLSKSRKYGAICDNVMNVRTTSSQVAKDENTDRVHWESPCEQSTHHQEWGVRNYFVLLRTPLLKSDDTLSFRKRNTKLFYNNIWTFINWQVGIKSTLVLHLGVPALPLSKILNLPIHINMLSIVSEI